jgi:hypothetical protein
VEKLLLKTGADATPVTSNKATPEELVYEMKILKDKLQQFDAQWVKDNAKASAKALDDAWAKADLQSSLQAVNTKYASSTAKSKSELLKLVNDGTGGNSISSLNFTPTDAQVTAAKDVFSASKQFRDDLTYDKLKTLQFARNCGTEAFIKPDQVCYTGLMENEPFMASLLQSSKVAEAARILTAGCHKNCPAANGHMPEAYPPLTCAPGANGTYWVNVVRQHFYYADEDQKDPSVVLKCEWVPADDLMVAKLATCDKFTAKRAAYIKKEFMCLKQKESQAARPPCVAHAAQPGLRRRPPQPQPQQEPDAPPAPQEPRLRRLKVTSFWRHFFQRENTLGSGCGWCCGRAQCPMRMVRR